MYCSNCGKEVNEMAAVCLGCGCKIERASDDKPSFWLAVLGFFVPVAGLVLYLVNDSKHPRKAKSAGKGALAGVITSVVLSVVFVALYIFGIGFLIFSEFDNDTDEILAKYADVTMGEFVYVEENPLNSSLSVTVKNKSKGTKDFDITIEAVNEDGIRLDTDEVYVESLKSGQTAKLKAFEDLTSGEAEDFKGADFKIVEIYMYDY